MSPKINSPSPATSRMQLAFCILVIPSFLVLTEFNCYAHAKLLDSNCSTTDKYAIGSTFESNLFHLLSYLYENAKINSAFSNGSFGSSPNEVYGQLMCFVDSTLADCTDCLKDATSIRTKPCSMGATATISYDSCTLSYSSIDSLSVADPYKPFCLYHSENSLDENTLNSLLMALATLYLTVPFKREMFAEQMVNGTNMSALMQCTRNLSPQECDKCIIKALSYLNWCSANGTAGGMTIMARNCYIRYESYVLNASSFPKSLVPPPPPSPPPPAPPLPTPISPSGGKVLQVSA